MKRWFFLSILVICSVFLHTYTLNTTPPGFNADEAAYGYNAYSILRTGADEFGNRLPLRLASFGDYKLPGYSYLTIPFVALFGLNETTTRLPAVVSALMLIPAMYFLAKELYNKDVALITAIFTTFSPWVHILARHAHEAVPMTLFLVLSLIYLIKFSKKQTILNGVLFILFLSLSLYMYHIARILYILYVVLYLYFVRVKRVPWGKNLLFMVVSLILLAPFILAEIIMPANRIQNLFLLTNGGIHLIAQQLYIEQAHSPFSNQLFIGIYEFLRRYITYFSLTFLTYTGDMVSSRFGYPSMAPLSIVEYVLFLVGIASSYISQRKNYHAIVLLLLLMAPLPAALTWQIGSLNRSYFLSVPALLLISYGVYFLWEKRTKIPTFPLLTLIFISGYTLMTTYVWTFYFFHYPKRAIVIRSWECGYKQLATTVKSTYGKYDSYHITRESGQPYIFLLFYLKYPPRLFSKTAHIIKAPDEYGFTQIEGFDKFIFSSDRKPNDSQKTLYVLSQAESQNQDKVASLNHVSSITCGTEHIFELYTPISTARINQTTIK